MKDQRIKVTRRGNAQNTEPIGVNVDEESKRHADALRAADQKWIGKLVRVTEDQDTLPKKEDLDQAETILPPEPE